MGPILLATLGIVALFILILLQVPIGVAMGIIGVIGYGLLTNSSASIALVSTDW